MIKKFVSFVILGIFLSLFVTSFVSAEMCKGSNGYWSGCSSKNSYSNSGYAQYSASPSYNQKINYDYSQDYRHSYDVNKDVRSGYDKTYKVSYDLDYSNEYKQGSFGYDSFRYYPNGYDHKYHYGTYGSQKTKVSYDYQVKESKDSYDTSKYSSDNRMNYDESLRYSNSYAVPVKKRY